MKFKSTKSALLMSALSLIMCVSMLVGTTFAWFTDSVTSANNVIKSGKLDIELYTWKDANTAVEITDASNPVFGSDILWEPGKTEVVYFSVKNAGSLDLKYKVALNVTNVSKNLFEVMEYAILTDKQFGAVTAWDKLLAVDVEEGINVTNVKDVDLAVGQEKFFAVAVHMSENANNKYMEGQVNFNIEVLAGQLASEYDEFGNKYDEFAGYAGTGFAPVVPGEAIEVQVTKGNEGYKVGSMVIPAAAIAAGTDTLEVNIVEVADNANITIGADQEAITYEVTVKGLKEGNTTPIKVALHIPAGLNPDTVKLYHYNKEVKDITYNPNTGYVTFETATFSPFTVVYKEEKYVAPEVDGTKLPEAIAKYSAEYVNKDLPWGSYGSWSPSAGLEANLETAYTFSCIEDLAAAKKNPFANWYCDFYVSLDKDLGANQIFLGGNYGDFGWVGFHNGDLTLAANTEMPLLGSVTNNPWTYLDVVQNVGEFICGAGDVNNALEGATLTVKLRLTNPENEAEFYDVETITYKF